jgi:hypothetical protein
MGGWDELGPIVRLVDSAGMLAVGRGEVEKNGDSPHVF